MEDLLERIKARLKEGAYPNEASVSIGIVIPILRMLGWDETDPEQVIPEYASGGRRVDFALCGASRRPNLFIEVKGVGRAFEGDRQLFEYAFHEGIPLCLLTDGRDWSFYLPGGQGSYDERRVYRLQIDERSTSECMRILERYLSRIRVKSGDAFDDAMRDYRDIASRREANRSLPQAWAELVGEPEDLLVELLSEQTEKISGYRPTSAEVTAFLLSLSPQHATESHRYSAAKVSVSDQIDLSHEIRQRSTADKTRERDIKYELFGQRFSAANASSAMVEILTTIAQRYPERLEAIAIAVRGKSRNHIARSVTEIYPARPDLARAVEFAPGWLVGLNIANREKRRIIQEACKVVGIRFGVEIKIDFPNADS
ncbi:MAG: hypothetical protein KF765_11145 [Parvibaculaceae bacterium]|nr:hypothetical protein [Parvibaculaceae bacterium]